MMNEAVTSRVSEQDNQIQFLFVGELHDIMFNPHLPDGLTVQLSEPEVKVSLSGVSHPIKYRAQGAVSCDPEQFDFVRSLISGRYVPISGSPISLPHIAYGKEKIAANGLIAEGYGLRQHHLPSGVRALCIEARRHLVQQVSKLVRMFRWAQNVDAPHNTFADEGGALYWKVDLTHEEFRIVPLRSNAQTSRSPIGIRWSEDDQKHLNTLLKSDVEEPLAHELRREGFTLWATAPRSAILALTSALEIGVKQHVASVAPNTAWLLEELPSPPIHKILKHYLPILHSDRKNIQWERLRTLCKSAQDLSEIRNKIAHAGKMSPNTNIDKFVSLVTDWLYILDFLNGHAWAADHVSAATRALLGWPPASYPTFQLSILVEE